MNKSQSVFLKWISVLKGFASYILELSHDDILESVSTSFDLDPRVIELDLFEGHPLTFEYVYEWDNYIIICIL